MTNSKTLSMYCNSLVSFSRYVTREVKVGNIGIGGNNPIRVQSMTTTDTMDTEGTVAQAIRMIEAGCELVRITAPNIKDAENLRNIKNALIAKGYNTPLVADIHFTPNAAEIAARIVEKVRINPGNFVDKKKFETLEYTEAEYLDELERIRKRFTPLVNICKEHGTAMRIGTNHGSLSDRILSRYGDTPLGMVESAMEFLRIASELDYHNIVLSMKASNTQVMVQAYRLLIERMSAENMNYPLHLGVTEAGDGEDGRIKSAVGIGTLLEDGLGDTIRVSLTEDPELEIPVAKALAERYTNRKHHAVIPEISNEEKLFEKFNPYEYSRRQTFEVVNIGKSNVPRVIADFGSRQQINPASFFAVGYAYSVPSDKWNLSDFACDYVFLGDNTVDFEIPGTLGLIYNYETWKKVKAKDNVYPLISVSELKNGGLEVSSKLTFVSVFLKDLNLELIDKLNSGNFVLVLETNNLHGMAEQRKLFFELLINDCKVPVVIKRTYANCSEENLQLYAATDIGALLLDGFGDACWIDATTIASASSVNKLAFGILQAARMRISKTEYISCPSCGRTEFDLQETTQKIRSRTDHLKGVKIGIMGCIVNGPGEMADADYGYVGTGVGKITLYKGREVVKRNIASAEAVDALIDLIKEHGDWVERTN